MDCVGRLGFCYEWRHKVDGLFKMNTPQSDALRGNGLIQSAMSEWMTLIQVVMTGADDFMISSMAKSER